MSPWSRFGAKTKIPKIHILPRPVICINTLSYTLIRFTLAVFVALIIQLYGQHLAPDALGAGRPSQTKKETPRPSGIKFKATRIGNGETPDGVLYGFTKFEAEDRTLAYILVIPFSSAKRAEEELQRRIKLATKIVRSNPQVDNKGKIVGQRVLALYTGNTPSHPLVKLTWTIGSTFFEINSESMANVLELERQSDTVPTGQGEKQ